MRVQQWIQQQMEKLSRLNSVTEVYRILDEARLQQLLAFLSRCPFKTQYTNLNHALANELQAFY
jgi:hypothetical protein